MSTKREFQKRYPGLVVGARVSKPTGCDESIGGRVVRIDYETERVHFGPLPDFGGYHGFADELTLHESSGGGAEEATGKATPKPLTRANLLCDGCGRDDGTHIGERGNGWILRCVTCHLSVDGDTEVEARGRWQGLMRRMGGAPEPARVLGPLTVLPTSAGFDILQDSQSGRLYALCEDDDGWPTLRPVVVEVADV